MPRLPGGQGSQLFGIGLFVPGQIPLEIAPQQAWQFSYLIRPLRANYSWVRGTNVALLAGAAADQFMPGQASSFYDFRISRFNYIWVIQSQPSEEVLAFPGGSTQRLVARSEWPRILRTWIQPTNLSLLTGAVVAESMPARAVWISALQPERLSYAWTVVAQPVGVVPAGQSAQQLVARPQWPRALRTWIWNQLFEEQIPVGESAQALVNRPEWLRALRTWIQSTNIGLLGAVEARPPIQIVWPVIRIQRANYSWIQSTNIPLLTGAVEAVPARALWADVLQPERLNYSWTVRPQPSEVAVEAVPAGQDIQTLVRWADYPRSLRTWTSTQLLEEGMPVGGSIQRIAVRPRGNYWFAQQTNVSLFSEVVVEQPPVGESVQVLVRWVEFPKGLRTWTQAQLFEEQMPVGVATQQRLRDPEYLRSLRSRAQTQLFEELLPPRPFEWPSIRRGRGTYNWVQATNIALVSAVEEVGPPSSLSQFQRVLVRRGDYGWVQDTNIALLTAAEALPVGQSILVRLRDPEYPRTLRSRAASKLFEEQVPVGGSVSQRLRDPEFLRSLRAWKQGTPYEERMPVGKSVFRRVPDPEFLRSLRAWSKTEPFEELMPVGEQIFRRVPDPEFLRSLRGRTRSQLPLDITSFDITVTPEFFVDDDLFFPPQILQAAPEPTYDYPIEHSLKSDYGIRKSRSRRGRYIIGRR